MKIDKLKNIIQSSYINFLLRSVLSLSKLSEHRNLANGS